MYNIIICPISYLNKGSYPIGARNNSNIVTCKDQIYQAQAHWPKPRPIKPTLNRLTWESEIELIGLGFGLAF